MTESRTTTKYPNRWPKGVSGNPFGRKKTNIQVQEIARQITPEALRVLMSVALNEKASAHTRMRAAAAILNVAWTSRRKFTFPLSQSKTMALWEYIDRLQVGAWGVEGALAEAYCDMQRAERQYKALGANSDSSDSKDELLGI